MFAKTPAMRPDAQTALSKLWALNLPRKSYELGQQVISILQAQSTSYPQSLAQSTSYNLILAVSKLWALNLSPVIFRWPRDEFVMSSLLSEFLLSSLIPGCTDGLVIFRNSASLSPLFSPRMNSWVRDIEITRWASPLLSSRTHWWISDIHQLDRRVLLISQSLSVESLTNSTNSHGQTLGV